MLRITRLLLPALRCASAVNPKAAPARSLFASAAPPLASVRRLLPPPARCLGSSHDAKLSSLLESELRFEKSEAQQQQQRQPQLPQPPEGFAVTARDGTRFTLAKKCREDGSLLEVSFDLNGSTTSPQDDEEFDEDEEASTAAKQQQQQQHQHTEDCDHGADGEAEEIQSRPDLIFRVRKPGSQTCLAVRCSFPPARVSRQMAAEDPDYPSLSIDTVAVEGPTAELGEYELEADMLNDDLYKQLAEMLVHRGVTRQFENSLVEFCTAQEHQLYLRFLAEAKKFCDA